MTSCRAENRNDIFVPHSHLAGSGAPLMLFSVPPGHVSGIEETDCGHDIADSTYRIDVVEGGPDELKGGGNVVDQVLLDDCRDLRTPGSLRTERSLDQNRAEFVDTELRRSLLDLQSVVPHRNLTSFAGIEHRVVAEERLCWRCRASSGVSSSAGRSTC